MLVTKRDLAKAVDLLHREWPELQIEDSPVVTRFIDPETKKGVIDVMKPTQDVFKMVFRHTVQVGDSHRIPNLEMALVSKFAAMTSPSRKKGRKMLDGADFHNIVEHNLKDIDRKKLAALAEKLCSGAGAEILGLVSAVEEDRDMVF